MSKPSDTSSTSSSADEKQAVAEASSSSADHTHNPFLEEGKKLLATIRRVEESQANWNSFLQLVYATEAEEGERCTALTREVLLEEAESLANPEFVRWMAAREVQHQREGSGHVRGDDNDDAKTKKNADRISEWFHHDGLALETPFSALIPFPKSLSCEGSQFFAASVDDLMRRESDNGGEGDGSASVLRRDAWYVCTTAVSHPLVSLAAELRGDSKTAAMVPSCGVSKSEAAARTNPATTTDDDDGYLSVPCRSGDDVVSLIRQNPMLQVALSETPCVFLSSVRPQYERVARIVVVRGVLAVVEVTEYRNRVDSGTSSLAVADMDKQQRAELVDYVYRDVVFPQAPLRSFTALLILRRAPKRSCGFRWSLWSMSELNVEVFETFTPDECITVAKVVSLLQRKQKRQQQQQQQSSSSEMYGRSGDSMVGPVFRVVVSAQRGGGGVSLSQEERIANLARELRVLLSSDSPSQSGDVATELVAAAVLTEASRRPPQGLSSSSQGVDAAPIGTTTAASGTPNGAALTGDSEAAWNERRHSTTTLMWTVVGVAAATAGVMLAITSRKR